MCHLIYDLFGGGILLGIELPESECVCGANGWKIGSPKLTKIKRICGTTKMSIYRPYMQIGDYFFCCLGECIVAATASFLFLYSYLGSFIILHFDTISRCHWNKRLSIMNTKT